MVVCATAGALAAGPHVSVGWADGGDAQAATKVAISSTVEIVRHTSFSTSAVLVRETILKSIVYAVHGHAATATCGSMAHDDSSRDTVPGP
jgi:hypothetical protein